MKTALLLALAAAVLPASAQAPLTEAQKEQCEAGGGCLTMTRMQVLKAMTDAYEMGRETGATQGYDKGQRTCWKPV